MTSKVKNGSIVLFHNDADHTPAALPIILKTLLDEGYEFVFISDLIYKKIMKSFTTEHSAKKTADAVFLM